MTSPPPPYIILRRQVEGLPGWEEVWFFIVSKEFQCLDGSNIARSADHFKKSRMRWCSSTTMNERVAPANAACKNSELERWQVTALLLRASGRPAAFGRLSDP